MRTISCRLGGMLGGLVLICAAVSARPTSAQTADEVIARYVAARGGLARLKSVRTERLTGHFTFASGAGGPDTVELARPMRIRTQISIAGKTLVQGYDGKTAWAINPFQGNGQPQVLEPGTAKNIAAGADMDGPLIDYAAKGNHVEFAGVDTADGHPAYMLRVTRPDSTVDTYYIDTVSYLQTKWEGHRTINGEPVVFESFFRDYRMVGGLKCYFRIDSDTQGRPGEQHIVIDKIELNVPEPDSRFTMPGVSSAPSSRGR